jgi:hypothetical protein
MNIKEMCQRSEVANDAFISLCGAAIVMAAPLQFKRDRQTRHSRPSASAAAYLLPIETALHLDASVSVYMNGAACIYQSCKSYILPLYLLFSLCSLNDEKAEECKDFAKSP